MSKQNRQLCAAAGGESSKRCPVTLAFVYLVANRQRPVTRDELVDALWAERSAPDDALSPLAVQAAARAAARRPRRGRAPRPRLRRLGRSRGGVGGSSPRAGGGRARRLDGRVGACPQSRSTSRRAGSCRARSAAGSPSTRRRLEELHLRALELVGRACVEIGGGELDTAERVRANARRPLAATGRAATALLMEALAARGNTAEALLVYESLRTQLRDELGTAPSPDDPGAAPAAYSAERVAAPAWRPPARRPSSSAGAACRAPRRRSTRGADEVAVVRRALDVEHRVRDAAAALRERLLELGLVVDVRRARVLDPVGEGVDDRASIGSKPCSRKSAAIAASSSAASTLRFARAARARPAATSRRRARRAARRARARARRRAALRARRRASGSSRAGPRRSPGSARRARARSRARARCRRGTRAARTTTRGPAPRRCA